MRVKLVLAPGYLTFPQANEITDSYLEKIETVMRKVLEEKKYLPEATENTEISLTFLPPIEMAVVNFEYREINAPTDVLSFLLWEEDGIFSPPHDWIDLPLGDIVVCPAEVDKNAEAAGKTFIEELSLVLFHAFLHLVGFDHDTDESESSMWKEQDRLLKMLDDDGAGESK